MWDEIYMATMFFSLQYFKITVGADARKDVREEGEGKERKGREGKGRGRGKEGER